MISLAYKYLLLLALPGEGWDEGMHDATTALDVAPTPTTPQERREQSSQSPSRQKKRIKKTYSPINAGAISSYFYSKQSPNSYAH